MDRKLAIPSLWLALFAAIQPVAADGPLSLEPLQFQPQSGVAVAAEMGSLIVPANRQDESDTTITLKFVRFKSTAKNPGAPIIYLAGGPGGSGIDAARGTRFGLFMAMREFGDVIALDQRGTGASLPSSRCTEQYQLPFDQALDRDQLAKAVNSGMRDCFARLRKSGIEPAMFNTVESAADIDDLRQALGADKVSLWGISYGTHLALATLRAHGAHIDRAILAGIEPLSHTLKLPSDQQQLLVRIDALVKADRSLRKRVPDLLVLLDRLRAQLREQPQTVTLVHPSIGQPIPVQVGELDLQAVVAAMLTGPETFADLPDFLWRLDQGDWTALALRAARFRVGSVDSAMGVATDCASGSSPEHLAQIAREAQRSVLADVINLPFPGVCDGLDVADLGEEFRAPLQSDVPVLLISGSLDGRTAQRNAQLVSAGLPKAQQLLIEGAGHSDPLFLASPKILLAMQRFMSGKTLAQNRIAAPAVQFQSPRTVVELPESTLARYAGSYQLEDGEQRQVIQAGNLLFTLRGNNPPFPLRALSDTEFFWEGIPGRARFEIAADGSIAAMLVDADGSGKTWTRAPRMD